MNERHIGAVIPVHGTARPCRCLLISTLFYIFLRGGIVVCIGSSVDQLA